MHSLSCCGCPCLPVLQWVCLSGLRCGSHLHLIPHCVFFFLSLHTACRAQVTMGTGKMVTHQQTKESLVSHVTLWLLLSEGYTSGEGRAFVPPNPIRPQVPLPISWGFVHPELREYCPDLDVSQQEGTGWLRSELSYPEGSQETPVGTWDVAASTHAMKCDRGLWQGVLDEGPSDVGRWH